MNRLILSLLLALLASPALSVEPEDATLVIFNSADPLSESLASYYAEKRGIPSERIIGLNCSITEEISREQYDQTIAEPLRRIFDQRGWWSRAAANNRVAVSNKIRFIALMRGMPLKIAAVQSYPGDNQSGPKPLANRNEAAVDSELATLGYDTRVISGAMQNRYFRSFARITDANFPALMLVCRLDAPTGSEVRRMIDDSLAAEESGLWGIAYIDIRNLQKGGHMEGDKWLQKVARLSAEQGIPVVMGHGGSLFSESYPMQNVAFYYGWYTQNVTGPFLREDFKFLPGAVACHIHSFSASTLRDPRTAWAGPLTIAGAAAVLGNVYEPYLGLTTQLDLFHERLLTGLTFAESAYMATSALSWMTTFIGDPLYRPMRVQNDITRDPPPAAAQWVSYRGGSKAWFGEDPANGRKQLEKAGRELKSGVIFEGLASLEVGAGNHDAALAASRTAREFYTDPADRIRVIYREANLLAGIDRKDAALDLLRRSIEIFRTHPRGAALVELRNELDPPPKPKKPARSPQ